MLRSKLRLASAALMVAGLSLVATPLAAAAHTGNLYTWAYSEDANHFAKISTSDAALTPLAPLLQDVDGADICNEEAWAVINSDEIGGPARVATWDHNTGVLGADHTLLSSIADFPGSSDVDALEVWAADSLSDCSKLAYVRYEVTVGENVTLPLFVSYVDAATGQTTPLIELPELGEEQVPIQWNGIATNPVTGVTYLFADYGDWPVFATLDIAGEVVSPLEELDGLYEHYEESGQELLEADFQPDGTLWLLTTVFQLDAYQLVSFAAGSDLAQAYPTVVGDPNAGDVPAFYDGDNVLTYDPEALANTGGGVPLGLLLPGGALFLAGLALIAVRRVRAAE